ncbi:MAG: urease accessory UreF family protein [Pseudomonadota bacterium]
MTIDVTATTRLAYWLSPAFPTGAFAYSHGLEHAFETGGIPDFETFAQWLEALLTEGSGWTDVVLCSLAWRAEDHSALSTLATALASCAERHQETVAQGSAFLAAAQTYLPRPELPEDTPLPICVGAATRAAGMDQALVLSFYGTAFVSNLVQAALRMGRFGQSDGARLMQRLEPTIIAAADKAMTATEDDIHTSTVLAELSALQHESMNTRIFAS